MLGSLLIENLGTANSSERRSDGVWGANTQKAKILPACLLRNEHPEYIGSIPSIL